MNLNSLIKVLVVSLFSVFLLSGCFRSVKSNVVTFHKLPKIDKKQKVSYSFLKLKGQENNLEYETYKDKIKQHLSKNNYFENTNSNLLFSFQYGIDNGTQKLGSVPVYGQTGVSSSYTTGTVNAYNNGYGRTTGNYSGTTTYTPIYGVVGSSTYSYSTYNRFLMLYIYDKNKKQVVYEGKVNSVGSSSSITLVIDEMIESLFTDFPGESGKSKRVSRPFIE